MPETGQQTSTPRGKMVAVKCKTCRAEFQAREADRKRGWGKFCSKSCKARNAKANPMGRFVAYQREFGGIPQFNQRTGEYEGFALTADSLEWDGHKE